MLWLLSKWLKMIKVEAFQNRLLTLIEQQYLRASVKQNHLTEGSDKAYLLLFIYLLFT